MAQAVSAFGCRGLEATGGEAGLELVRREAPDLILLDLEMPDMNGPQFIEELRKTHAALPVVIVTVYPESELMQQAMPYSPVLLLAKSVEPALLERSVRAAVGEKPASAGGGATDAWRRPTP